MSNLDPNKVDSIILRFETQAQQDLPILMQDARVLSAQAYWYADAIGLLLKQYVSTRVQRKSRFAAIVAECVNDGTSVASARNTAENDADYQSIYLEENELDARFKKGKMLLDSINKVLDRMNQEIAELRKERENIRHT